MQMPRGQLSHMERLEAESIHIIREAAAEARKPVLLYSMGKDSSVLLHLARRAFHPAPPPFPLLHVDTSWKFRAMYDFRESAAADAGMELIVHKNPEAEAAGINPFDHGPLHTQLWKTEGLKQALDAHGFDAAIGGARRDEETSRAKERVASVRSPGHRWDPRSQRPELWRLYNMRVAKGDTLRIFPLSDWTEIDVWRYIKWRGIPVVPLYFAGPRPTVVRDGAIIAVDDARLPLGPGEQAVERKVRFRTLGCYPLTGGVESDAATIDEIIAELESASHSERSARLIDVEDSSSMEAKKREGYF